MGTFQRFFALAAASAHDHAIDLIDLAIWDRDTDYDHQNHLYDWRGGHAGARVRAIRAYIGDANLPPITNGEIADLRMAGGRWPYQGSPFTEKNNEISK